MLNACAELSNAVSGLEWLNRALLRCMRHCSSFTQADPLLTRTQPLPEAKPAYTVPTVGPVDPALERRQTGSWLRWSLLTVFLARLLPVPKDR